MITVHHLEYSRSTRILWLLEELDEPYEMIRYQRDPKTFRATPELKAAHPLGKSPVVDVDGQVIAESGAILEFLAATCGGGRLARQVGDAEWVRYLEWLHFGEGTAMMGIIPIMLSGADSQSRACAYGQEVVGGAMGEIEAALADGRDYLLAGGFSAADIQNAYVAAVAGQFGLLADRPIVTAWVDRCLARSGLERAMDKGGPWLLPLKR